MAGSSLFALLDDIATVLDDVATMTKVAAKKTAGVLGDDLALNAQQVQGVRAERELPVVWAVAKGSAFNKVLLVPVALLLSAFMPVFIKPLLMLGGAFLCFEGVEKLWHWVAHRAQASQTKLEIQQALHNPNIDFKAFEADKISGAIRTDFILSAEIIVIALGTVANETLAKQALVLSVVAVAITIGVYGLVALIVKLDDIGLYLTQRDGSGWINKFWQQFGFGLLALCPWIMKTLSVVGTLAMFLVGGGILLHTFPGIEQVLASTPLGYTVIMQSLSAFVVGVGLGIVTVAVVSAVKWALSRTSRSED